jgi:putative transcriptional regulator
MSNMVPFRDAVRANRTERSMTQAHVAAEVGVTASHIADIERGNREPSEDLALRLCEVFHIDQDFYFACAGLVPIDLRDKAPTILMDSFAQLRQTIKDKGW